MDGVGAAFGFHVAPWIPTGTIQTVTTGQAMMGAAAWFDMNVTGVGGHGALPHLARDPVPAAAAIISAFQTIVSRETDPMAASVSLRAGWQAGALPPRSAARMPHTAGPVAAIASRNCGGLGQKSRHEACPHWQPSPAHTRRL